jgi:hypothetical protein
MKERAHLRAHFCKKDSEKVCLRVLLARFIIFKHTIGRLVIRTFGLNKMNAQIYIENR